MGNPLSKPTTGSTTPKHQSEERNVTSSERIEESEGPQDTQETANLIDTQTNHAAKLRSLTSSERLEISLDEVIASLRHLRCHFATEKKDYIADLTQDKGILEAFRKSSSFSPSLSETEISAQLSKDMEFIKRFDNVTTVKHILFTPETQPSAKSSNSNVLPTRNQAPSTPQQPPLHEVADHLEAQESEVQMTISEQEFTIKLYIAEPQDKRPLNWFERIGIEGKLVTLFGRVHVGLQIGDKMVHFFNNGFVKIDSFKAEYALYLINISESGRLPKNELVKTLIATVIVDWNKRAKYDEELCNCQDFVEEMCFRINKHCRLKQEEKLSLKFNGNKLIKDYLDVVRQNPDKVKGNTGFFFPFNGENKVFSTHAELDDWEEREKDKLTPDEKAFLKGFHRAFQLRLAAAEREEAPDRVLRIYRPGLYGKCAQGNATIIT